MSGWLTALGPAGTALALLVLGHVLGDFVFQTDEMARNKHRVGPLLSHVGVVIVVHLVAFLPLLTTRTALLVVAVGGVHLLIDAVTARLRPRGSTSTPLFLGDQLAHLLVIVVGWSLLAPSAWTVAPVVTALGGVDRLPWSEMTAGALYAAAFAFAHKGGNTIVRGVLPEEGPEPDEGDDLEAGSIIGSLERWIVLLLGLAGRWEAVALVIAAKSIARFEEPSFGVEDSPVSEVGVGSSAWVSTSTPSREDWDNLKYLFYEAFATRRPCLTRMLHHEWRCQPESERFFGGTTTPASGLPGASS